jgi:phenylpropionate dioxygenase-like ring-hydroxylating dioxygenase large terminal subunit
MPKAERDDDPGELPYRAHNIPKLGFAEYWYPIVTSRELKQKPKGVKLLGREIVLYRDAGKLYAMEDRCPHRGVKLSLGECLYKGTGTISCPYHGWTFDGANGKLVAAIMDGPEAPITRKVTQRIYPVREHAGMIWLWGGEGEASRLEDDIPEWIADQKTFFSMPMYTDYACNWRWLVDNWGNDQHAQYVHRKSPELFFQPQLPFNLTIEPKPLPNGRGMAFKRIGGVTSAEFPGLGRFPNNEWWRFMKPRGRGNIRGFENSRAHKVYGIPNQSEVWLPGMVLVGRLHGEYALVQLAVPIDENTTRCWNINNFRRTGKLVEWFDRLHYFLWRGWAHDRIFSDQDKVLLEAVIPGPERLSKSDLGVIAWRKFMGANARRPPGLKEAARDVA